MTVNGLQSLEAAFGWRGFPDALFYHAPYGLRFELGADLEMGPIRFMQALDRARTVAAALFSSSDTLTAFVSIYDDKHEARRHSAALRRLRGIGFPHPFGPSTKVPLGDEEHIALFGRDLFRHWYAAPFKHDDASVPALLWASVAREMDIRPKTRWIDTIHIADLQARIALTVYDDRGMDVIGPDKSSLTPLYQGFNSWLLDYDRADMDTKFSA